MFALWLTGADAAVGGAEPGPAVCRVTVTERRVEALDEVAYQVRLRLDVRCPRAAGLRVAGTRDGVEIVGMTLERRGRDGGLVQESIFATQTVLPAGAEVPACVAASRAALRRVEFSFIGDRRRNWPAEGAVTLQFESTCRDRKRGTISTTFESRPVGFAVVRP